METFEEMFYGASSFNSPIGDWDISSADTVAGMFNGASSFNQNLCAWRDSFPYGFESSKDIFANSGCTFKNRPRLSNSNEGPFCASDCSPTVTESPIVSCSVQYFFDFVVHILM